MKNSVNKPLWKRIVRRLQHEIQWREHVWRPVGLPRYVPNTPAVSGACFEGEDESGRWYSPALLGASTIGQLATGADSVRQVLQVLRQLEPDPYMSYLLAYYQAGLDRFGETWQYADITTVLLAAGRLLQPRNYLEIGVRRGRSMAMIAAACPQCQMLGFDIWVEGYAGTENPGPDLVQKELRQVGFQGKIEFVNGDSHRTLTEYFSTHADAYFDLITVDGDHSLRGASRDLRDVLPRLRIGGAIVLDDISQLHLEYLAGVWDRFVGKSLRFSTWEYRELGYGIAIGIRKY